MIRHDLLISYGPNDMAYFSMVQTHGTERYNCETLEVLTRKFIPNEKRNFTCWIRIEQDKGRDTNPDQNDLIPGSCIPLKTLFRMAL